MTNQTEARYRRIRARVRRCRRRAEKRGLTEWGAACAALAAGLGLRLRGTFGSAQAAVQAGSGSILLKDEVSAYVVVAIAAFSAGAVLAAACLRKRRMGQAAVREKEEKACGA